MVLGPADVGIGRGNGYGGGFQLGLHYRARPDLAFALAYRSPSWFGDVAGGRAKIAMNGLIPIHPGSASLDEVRLPAKITGGVAWDATDWLKLVGEVRWINYENSTFNSARVAINGPIDIRMPLPLGYKNQWVFITGADIKLDEHWVLSLGYHFNTEAVKESSLLPGASVIVQHHATIGLRYQQDNWWVGAGYLVAFNHAMSSPRRSAIPLGIDYGSGRLSQTQHAVGLGFGMSW
jgi:long-subunit fatty acid transport protein